jgi:hypothetical protein
MIANLVDKGCNTSDLYQVGGERLELSRLAPTDPKSALSTNFSNRP